MKKHIKSLSLLIVVFMILQMLTVGVLANDVAAYSTTLGGTATGYTKASDVQYQKVGSYVANWGARGETATFLTTYATDFHSGSYSFDTVSKLGGATTEAGVPSSALYAELKTFMSSKQTYQTSYNATRDLFRYTDCVNGNYSAGISSFYSGDKIGPAWDGGSTWNREHTWPNSKGDASGNGENDIMMLRPTASSENGSRGNKAYGQSTGYYNPNSESGGAFDLRGDVARIVLYTYVRWGCTNTGSNPNGIFGTDGVIESLAVMLAWIEADPVDTWELGRNDSVQTITGTRNVFVDYPEYAFLLFGREVPEDMVTPSGEAKEGIEGGIPNEDVDTPTGGATEYVAVQPEVGTSYKVGMNQTAAGKTVYIKGGMAATYYLDTSESPSEGLDFYIEAANGGYYLYYLNGTTKTYINFTVSGTHVNAVYSTTPNTVYTYDANLKTFVTSINDGTYALGTRSDNTYTTIGPVDISINNPFVVNFFVESEVGGDDVGGTTPEDTTTQKPEDTTTAPVTPPVTGNSGKVSKTHTEIATIAGVTAGQSTGIIAGKQIKLDGVITIVAAKGTGGTDPTIYSESIRLYQNGNTLTIKAAAGYELDVVRIKVADNSQGKGPISVTGGTASALTGNVYTITANDGVSEIVIKTMGTDKNTRVYIANIEVEYAPVGGSEGGDDIGGGTTPEDNTTNAPVNPPVEDDTTNTPENPPEEETTVPTTPSTPSGSLTVGGQYKIGMNQTAAGKVVYLNGEINGYYLDTTENINSALVFVIEEANGGYYVSTTINGAKKYLNMVVSGTHVNAVYEDAPSTVYTYDETLKTLIGIVDGNQYVFGTRNDKTYTTVGANKLSYEPFMIFLSKVEAGTPDDDTPVNPPVEDNTTQTPENPPEEETTVPTTPSTPSGSLTVGGQYKIGMNQTAAGKVVYLNGEINGYYLDTTENINSALVFVIEEANGGYYVSTTINGAKKYLNMVVSGTHVNAVYEDAPSTVYTYDETLKTLIGIVDGNQYVFGTRNDKTYTTIGANKLSYEPFMIFLSKVESGTPGGDDDNQGGTGEEGTTAPDEEGTTAPDEEGTTAPDEEPTTEPTTEPVTEPTTEAPTEEVTTAIPDGASTDVTGDTPTDEGNSDEGKGCKSSISGISAVIIAIAIPMFLYRKKKED